MNPFAYVVPTTLDSALAALVPSECAAHDAPVRPIAGGTNLIDLMKETVARPGTLLDINRLGLDRIERSDDGGLCLGATARNADTAWHPLVREHYPLLHAAILAGASPQIRNMASNAGNLLQRTRCIYFYDAAVPCNKREPGSGCPAIGGLNRQHAILGSSDHCIATHPSDMCVALAALDAEVHVRSTRGARTIPFAEFHRLPGDRPQQDTTLAADELITHLRLPPAPQFAAHTSYLKLRDRASYAFALVSVAAMLDVDDAGSIRAVRVALGGVAHKPWRDPDAESSVVGARAHAATFAQLADAMLRDARGLGLNDFKIPLAHRAIVRALEMARDGERTNVPGTGHAPERAA